MKLYLLIATLSILLPLLLGCSTTTDLIAAGPLRHCPDSPNCVSSMDERPKYKVAPLTYTGEWELARDRLATLLGQMTRTRVKAVKERYLRAECRSRIFGFVDDVEFYFDPAQPIIQMRSASRTGYSDLGVNRKRVEMIRALWEKTRS